MLAEGKISEADLAMITVTDDVDEAVRMMVEASRHHVPSRSPQ